MILPSAQNISICFPVQPPANLRHARTVLVVEAPGALRLLEDNTAQPGVVLTHMRMLNPRMLTQVAPDAIIGPLIADGWDGLDLATALEDMGYRGTLFILSRQLPNAELILHEMRACCPKLSIALIETP